jgi:hypothetical protein
MEDACAYEAAKFCSFADFCLCYLECGGVGCVGSEDAQSVMGQVL